MSKTAAVMCLFPSKYFFMYAISCVSTSTADIHSLKPNYSTRRILLFSKNTGQQLTIPSIGLSMQTPRKKWSIVLRVLDLCLVWQRGLISSCHSFRYFHKVKSFKQHFVILPTGVLSSTAMLVRRQIPYGCLKFLSL